MARLHRAHGPWPGRGGALLPPLRCLAAACLLVCCSAQLQAAGLARDAAALPAASLHTVFGADCTPFFDWQSLGVVYSHAKARVPGPITRLLSCTPAELAAYRGLDLVPRTHVTPSWSVHPITGDYYPAINKPVAVLHWLERAQPAEEWVLMIDPDMVIRDPMADWGAQFGAGPGWALSVFFAYMIGTHNNLSATHVPEVRPREDTIAGPRGRRADQVSAVVLMLRDDLQRVAPWWLRMSEAVREDPMAWNETNDEYATKPGMKPWISEMYGYAFGAAKAGVWHRIDYAAMLYPGKAALDVPRILHYGRLFEVAGYRFRKHWHHKFDALRCPSFLPWGRKSGAGHAGGLFAHPPRPAQLPPAQEAGERYRDLLALQTVATLNAALCQRHLTACPPAPRLAQECAQVKEREAEIDAALAEMEAPNAQPPICRDMKELCTSWAQRGMCAAQPQYMHIACRRACNLCWRPPGSPRGPTPPMWPASAAAPRTPRPLTAADLPHSYAPLMRRPPQAARPPNSSAALGLPPGARPAAAGPPDRPPALVSPVATKLAAVHSQALPGGQAVPGGQHPQEQEQARQSAKRLPAGGSRVARWLGLAVWLAIVALFLMGLAALHARAPPRPASTLAGLAPHAVSITNLPQLNV